MKKFNADTMAYVFILLMLFLSAAFATAQDVESKVKLEGTTFVEVKSDKVSLTNSTKTKYTYKEKDGKEYPIYISKNGKAFIIRVSKKSGKEYRKYLPEVTEKIAKEYIR